MLESIKCSTGGAYYLHGQWVQADADAPAVLAAQGVDAAAAAEAYKGTMAYGIMEAHNTSGNMENLKLIFREIITKITQNFRNRVPLQK